MTGTKAYFRKPVTSTPKGIDQRPSATGCREGSGRQHWRLAVGAKPGEHIPQRDPFQEVRIIVHGDSANGRFTANLEPEVPADRDRVFSPTRGGSESLPGRSCF